MTLWMFLFYGPDSASSSETGPEDASVGAQYISVLKRLNEAARSPSRVSAAPLLDLIWKELRINVPKERPSPDPMENRRSFWCWSHAVTGGAPLYKWRMDDLEVVWTLLPGGDDDAPVMTVLVLHVGLDEDAVSGVDLLRDVIEPRLAALEASLDG